MAGWIYSLVLSPVSLYLLEINKFLQPVGSESPIRSSHGIKMNRNRCYSVYQEIIENIRFGRLTEKVELNETINSWLHIFLRNLINIYRSIYEFVNLNNRIPNYTCRNKPTNKNIYSLYSYSTLEYYLNKLLFSNLFRNVACYVACKHDDKTDC